MESKRTETAYFIPPGKFLLMENALGNPDLIQSSVASDCRVTVVDLENFPLDDLEQWPTFRLVSNDIKLKLGEGKYYIYIVVPTTDNTEATSAFISYNTVKVDRKGYSEDGMLLGKAGFRYYPCGTVSARGGNPSATVTPYGKGRLIEMDLGVTPSPSTLPGDLNDYDKIFRIDKVDPSVPGSWLLTILATVKEMTARLIRVTGSIVFGSGENEKHVTDVATSSDVKNEAVIDDTILPTTAWVQAKFNLLDERYLRKDKDDRSVGIIATDTAFEVGKFVAGASGAIIQVDKNTGQTVAELDKLYVRMKAYFETLEIINVNSVGGKMILSPAGSVTCFGVEELEDSYRCYFLGEQDGEVIENRFKSGDQAYSQMFNAKVGVSNKVSNHYYWRLVTSVSEDVVDYNNQKCHYIDLSKTDCDSGSDIPKAGDVINQRGSRTDSDRMNFIEFSSVGVNAPYITLFQGVNSYSLVDKDYVSYGYDQSTGKAYMNVYGDMYVGDRNEASYMRYTQENGLEIKGKLSVGTTLKKKDGSEGTLEDMISASTPEGYQEFVDKVTQDIEGLQQQIDGAIESYFYQYEPSLENYPAMEWDTALEKEAHLNDTFTNLVDGRSWRWTVENGVYGWTEITDTATTQALALAGQAKDTADGKRRVFTSQPTPPYDKGDLWSQGSDAPLMICVNPKTSGSYAASDWDYADNNAKLKEEMQSLVSTTKDELNNAIGQASEAANTYTDNAKEALEESLAELDKAKAGIDSVYTKAEADGKISEAEQAAIDAAKEQADAAIALSEEVVKAYADGEIDKEEQARIKQAQENLDAAKKYAEEKAKEAEDAIKNSYLFKALTEAPETTIENGLVLSSLIQLRNTDGAVKSGINGIINDSKGNKSIANWWGGIMDDMTDYHTWNGHEWIEKSGVTIPSNLPTGLIRMDGTGYLANGKFWWDETGKIYADPTALFLSFDVNAEAASLSATILNILDKQTEFADMWEVKKDASGNEYLFTKRNIVTQGGVTMYHDLTGLDIEGIYDGLPIDGTTLYWDNGILKARGGSGGGTADSVLWDNIDGKPTWITDSKPEYKFIEIKETPTTLVGYGITDAKIANGVITLGTSTITPLTQTLGDSRYLKLTGGTLSNGSENSPLMLDCTSRTPIITFKNNGANAGFVGGSGSSTSMLIQAGSSNNEEYSVFKVNVDGSLQVSTNADYYDVLTTKNYASYLGYIGTTKVQKLSATQNLTGIGSINSALTITKGTDDTTLRGSGHYMYFGGSGYANQNYYFRPLYGASGTTAANLYIQNASASDSPTFTTTHRFLSSGDATHTGALTVGKDASLGGALTVNGIKLYKSQDGVLYLEGDLAVKGGVTMYATDAIDVPSIIDALPTAGYNGAKGVASFDSSQFVVTDGVVTFVGASSGVSETFLADYLKTNNYAKKTDIPTIPTSLKNPYALSIKNSAGTEQVSYDGSAAKSLTLSKAMVGLGNVENTALSSWAGSSKITTLGTISSGTWNGTKIANAYLANSAITISGTSVSLGGSITQAALRTALGLGSNAYTSTAYLPLSGGTIDGTVVIKGSESNNIDTKSNNNGAITNVSTNLAAIRHALRFRWYETDWQIGNIRSDTTSSLGFGITKGNDTCVFRVNENGAWVNEKTIIHGENIGSYNSGSATKLQTSRTLWGKSFDGTANVSGDMSSVGSITMSGGLSLTGDTADTSVISFARKNANYITFSTSGSLNFGSGASTANTFVRITGNGYVGIGTTSPTYRLMVSEQADAAWTSVFNTPNSRVYIAQSSGRGIYAGVLTGVATSYLLSLKYNQTTLGSGGTSALYVRTDGNVGIGTETPNTPLDVYGAITLSKTDVGGDCAIHFARNHGYINFAQGGSINFSNGETSGAATIMRISGSGYVGINTTSPSYALHVIGDIGNEAIRLRYSTTNPLLLLARSSSSETWYVQAINGYLAIGGGSAVACRIDASGNLLSPAGITMYSDIRKKTKLQDVELTLKQIADAPLIEHYYNSDDKKTTHVGSIAQYWAGLNDWFCKADGEGYYTMEIQNAALASAISIARELVKYESKTDKKIRMLKKRICELEDKIELLEKK